MKTQNPFLIRSEFIPQKHFIMQNETKSIISILSSGENVFILANREIEKADLVENVFYQLEKEKITTLYFNLRKNVNLKSLLISIAEKLTKDTYSNYPLNDLKFKLVEILIHHRGKCVIAFNNIQFAEEELVNYLDSLIAEKKINSEKINLILVGPEKLNIGNNIPEINLNLNSEGELQKYISKSFGKGRIKINKKVITKIIDWSEFDLYTLKLVCSKLWSLNKLKITKNDLKFVLSNLLSEYEPLFLQMKKLLSDYQWKLLKAIAIDKNSIQLTSVSFINKYGLNAPSSVKTAITALQEKGLIIKSGKVYKLTNIVLSRWLDLHHLA
jgi:hypothetical protein